MKNHYRNPAKHYSHPLIAKSLIGNSPYRKAIDKKRYKRTPYKRTPNQQQNAPLKTYKENT